MLNWLGKRKWGIIIGLLIFLISFEMFELLYKDEPFYDPFHIIELTIYLLILLLIGLLINVLVKANDTQKRTIATLNHKNKLSLFLAELDNWDMLISNLVELPSTIAPVGASRLYVYNSISGKLDEVSDWSEGEAKTNIFHYNCQKCLEEHEIANSLFSPCCSSDIAKDNEMEQSKEYCLPITYANALLALIQFKLKPDEKLSDEQEEIFENIVPEIASALKVRQEQKQIADMRLAETALAERHSISTYLHDNLSQNLAYLCLKLDQFTAGGEQFSKEEWIELQHMKDAANLSYEIVRDMVETIYPETTPHLVNLIIVYTKKVSQRAGIEINVNKVGKEKPILPEVQQTVFYVFQEALSNVEKHAKAQKVDILIDWGQDGLSVSITDDGIGVDLNEVDRTKHFGMEIMRERVEKVNGRIDVCSSIDSGTKLTIFVPIALPQNEGN